MISRTAFAFFLAQVSAISAAQGTSSDSGCPSCLNGGICLPSKRIYRGTPKFRCFCPSPWVGEACESQGTFDEAQWSSATLQNKERRFMSNRMAVESAKRFATKDNYVRTKPWKPTHDVFLMTLHLKSHAKTDHADDWLPDETSVRFAVYSALCPSAPCPLGLVMEDIHVASFAQDEVRLAISSPSNDDAENSMGSQLTTELESQLDNDDSALRGVAFEGRVVKADLVRLAQSKRASGLLRVAHATHARNRTVPVRPDRHVSLAAHDSTSTTTHCIAILSSVFLLVSMAHILLERISRWLFPEELVQALSFEESDVGTENDYQMFRSIVDMARIPLVPVINLIVLMHIVQTRAQELTRGFGDPPKWARDCMIAIVVAELLCVWGWIAQVWLMGGRKKLMTRLSLSIFWKSKSYVMALILASSWTLAICEVALWICVFTMTPGDCTIASNIVVGSLWPNKSSPPSLSEEHVICMMLVIQFSIVSKLEYIVLSYGVVVRRLFGDGDSKGADSLKHRIENRAERCRLLTKTAYFAPITCVLILAVSTVPTFTDKDETFRTFCMHTVQAAELLYCVLVLVLIVLPKEAMLTWNFGYGAVKLTSAADYMISTESTTGALMFRVTRRLLLLTAYISASVLGCSVFFLSSGDGGPAPVVDWAVMWTIFLVLQSIVVYVVMLLHEFVYAPPEKDTNIHDVTHMVTSAEEDVDDSNGAAIRSAICEIEGFVGLVPVLGILFLVSYARGHHVMTNGQLPQWVLTSMNVVAQTMLLQIVLVLVEANIGRCIFVDKNEWRELYAPRIYQKKQEADEFVPQTPDGGAPTLAQSPRLGSRNYAIEAAKLRLEGDDQGYDREGVRPQSPLTLQPLASREVSRGRLEVDPDLELRYLHTRSLNLFATSGQICLLVTLCIACELIFIAVWTLDSKSAKRRHLDSDDWKGSVLPLLPVSSPTSLALEALVLSIAVFFVVKGASALINTLRAIYPSEMMSWYICVQFHRAEKTVEMMPLACLLFFMVQSRAVAFHGGHASPPYVVQAHMIAVVFAKMVQVCAVLISPALTHTSTKAERRGRFIPMLRRFWLVVEQISIIIVTWGLLIVILAIILMRPEDVVLGDGSNGQPWRGKGDAPSLPFVAWVMLSLCLWTFMVYLANAFCQSTLTRFRYEAGGDLRRQREKFAEWLRIRERQILIRLHIGFELARTATTSSVFLGALFVPLSSIKQPVVVVYHDPVEENVVDFMKMLFFVGAMILLTKTFIVFWLGYVQDPQQDDVIDDGEPEEVIGDEDDQPCSLERPASKEFRIKSENTKALLPGFFRRTAIAFSACEFIVITVLAIMLYVTIHNHSNLLKGSAAITNGPFWLFGVHWFAYSFWALTALNGVHAIRTDGMLDVVSVSPPILLLYMALRQRAVELAGAHALTHAAGAHAVVPTWLMNLLFVSSAVIVVELILVLFASNVKKLAVAPSTASQQNGREVLRSMLEKEDNEQKIRDQRQRSWRVAYISARTVLRMTQGAAVGPIIFGLFWMTEDQCFPQ